DGGDIVAWTTRNGERPWEEVKDALVVRCIRGGRRSSSESLPANHSGEGSVSRINHTINSAGHGQEATRAGGDAGHGDSSGPRSVACARGGGGLGWGGGLAGTPGGGARAGVCA